MSPVLWCKAPSPNRNRRYPGLCTDSQQEATRQGWSPAQRVESKWTDAQSIHCKDKTGYQGWDPGQMEKKVTFTPDKWDHLKQETFIVCKIYRKVRCKKIKKAIQEENQDNQTKSDT